MVANELVLLDEAIVSLEGGRDLISYQVFFMCGRFLSDKPMSVVSLSTALFGVWRLKDNVMIFERRGYDPYVSVQGKKGDLSGAPWRAMVLRQRYSYVGRV